MMRPGSMSGRTCEGGGPTHAAWATWRAAGLPDWGAIWSGCARRVRAWRLPPRWSAGDWFEELQAHGVAVAWQAVRAHDPARGIPLAAFVRLRVLFGVRDRYRQEWAYALHCGCEPPADGEASPPAAPFAPHAYEALQGPLAQLADADRRLIEHLFWDGRTEADLARELGISQSAISQRKRAILLRLRRSLGGSGENMEEFCL